MLGLGGERPQSQTIVIVVNTVHVLVSDGYITNYPKTSWLQTFIILVSLGQESGCSLEGSSASEVACKAVKCQPGLRASGEAAASELIRMVVGWIEFLTGWRLPSVPSTQTSSQGSSQDVSLLPHGKQEERENEQNDHSNLLYLNLGNGILSPLLRCVLAASLWVQCTLRGSGLYQEQLAAGRATGGHRELAYSWTATCFLMQRPAHLQAQSRHRPNAYGQAAAKQEWRLTG